MTCRAILTSLDGRQLTCDQPTSHKGAHSSPLTTITGRIHWTYQGQLEVTDAH